MARKSCGWRRCLSGRELADPVSTGVSIFIVTTPALSHRAIARCGGKSSGIGLVETSSAIAVPGASSPGSGRRPIAQSSVNIFSCTCAHEVIRATIERSNNLWPENLTPGPFPSGKGSKTEKGTRLGSRESRPTSFLFPFPLGKGLGVRFFGSTSIPGRTFHRPLIRVAAIVAIVVQNLEPPLPNDVLIEREASRQPGIPRTRRLIRIRQLRRRIERRHFIADRTESRSAASRMPASATNRYATRTSARIRRSTG